MWWCTAPYRQHHSLRSRSWNVKDWRNRIEQPASQQVSPCMHSIFLLFSMGMASCSKPLPLWLSQYEGLQPRTVSWNKSPIPWISFGDNVVTQQHFYKENKLNCGTLDFTDSLSISHEVRPHLLNILEVLGNEGGKRMCRKENTNDTLREYS